MTPWWGVALGLSAALGCGAPPPEHIAMKPRQPDVLLELIPPTSSEPLPPALATGEALFAQARADYQARRYAEAAQGFLAAARASTPDVQPLLDSYAEGRADGDFTLPAMRRV